MENRTATAWRNALAVTLWAAAGLDAQIYYPAGMPAPGEKHQPTVITQGGTYRGNWTSLDPDVPAVLIDTREKVVLENSVITSKSHGIEIKSARNADVTIRGCWGFGLNPGVEGRMQGRFLFAKDVVNLRVENCFVKETNGIFVNNYWGNKTALQTIRIVRNQFRNIMNRYSDGKGGYSDRVIATNYADMRQFCQFADVKDIAHAEIAWNEVINEPFVARVEDVVNMYQSRGLKDSPIRIHDNFIDGAYSERPDQDIAYTGGGVLCGDGPGTGYIHGYDNIILRTQNYGIAIADGEFESRVYRNTVLSAGLLPDGRRMHKGAGGVGVYVWGWRGTPPVDPYAYENRIAYMKEGGRSDSWLPECPPGNCRDNLSLPGPVTRPMEDAQYSVWFRKLQDNGVGIGPGGSGTSALGRTGNAGLGTAPPFRKRGLVLFRQPWTPIGPGPLPQVPVDASGRIRMGHLGP